MKLTAYVIDGHKLNIRPAPVEREWMDATNERFAYRCLPLNIANAHGWEILCASSFAATWDGGAQLDAIKIDARQNAAMAAISHFGHGTLTFHIPCLFRTEPGYDLMAQGPINRPKDGIAPLAGIIETDWAPYTFTMNWIFTRAGVPVRFEQGEPFCHVFPVQRNQLASLEPEMKLLSADPELERQFNTWNESRAQFNADLQRPGSEAQAERWQKLYYRGLAPDGTSSPIKDHTTRLRLRPFSSK
ncbi:MAG: hypothetical protein QOD40_419 [Alphaproteobacteria bacterium]|jgi:hypothetical protein|nr:hypothetical protein [Alphaproteobacteria bacterium]